MTGSCGVCIMSMSDSLEILWRSVLASQRDSFSHRRHDTTSYVVSLNHMHVIKKS